MSERLKEPVLKTGDAQASVGSNPTLSATIPNLFGRPPTGMQKYPSGRRGSPAKGVGRETVARVQIPPSAPENLGIVELQRFRGFLFLKISFEIICSILRKSPEIRSIVSTIVSILSPSQGYLQRPVRLLGLGGCTFELSRTLCAA